MVTHSDIIKKGREFIGTPFVHQGRLKGIGVDCIGLITGVAKELGLFDVVTPPYRRYSDGTLLMQEMLKVFDPADLDSKVPGDIIIYWVDKSSKHPQHVGILTETGVIHTYDRVMKVIEAPTTPRWEDRITHVFKWRELE